MRCKQCDYRLWNLRRRDCPECGSPFKPSDYEFVINSVRFCCPHCNQAYYGTGEFGHLVPIEFDCASCGTHIHMDETIVLPTENVREEQTQVDQNPWLDRRKRGRIKAWFAAIGQSMVVPHRMIDATPMNSSSGQAIWFAVVTGAIYTAVGASLILLLMMLPAMMGGGMVGLASILVGPLVMAMLYVLFIYVWAGVTHVLLRLTGPLPADFSRTTQAISYSSGANVFTAVPCLSPYVAWIGWIWWAISATVMVQRGHRISGRRAAFATLPLPMILIVAMASLIGWGIYEMTVAMQAANAQIAQANQTSMQTFAAGLTSYNSNNGRWPAHATELLITGPITINDLTATPSLTAPNAIQFGGTDAMQFSTMTHQQKQAAVRQAADNLPPDTVAYRLGDVVFTYPGIDFASADPGLWIAISSLDPQVNQVFLQQGGITGSNNMVIVAMADGTTVAFATTLLPAELAAQNQLRTSFNLPPLPDPATVLHDQPHRDSPGGPLP